MKFIYNVEQPVEQFGVTLSTSLSDLTYDMVEVVAFYSAFSKGAMSLEDIVEALRTESLLDGEEEDAERAIIEEELLALYGKFETARASDASAMDGKLWESSLSDDETTLIIKVT